VLSSLGVVVNKGNLGALQDITDEAYAAVAGRAGSFAELIPRLAELAGSLDQQTSDIIAAADGLDRFAGILARGKDSLGRALDTLPAALKVLNDNRSNIVDAFTALRTFAGVASHVLSETKSDFAADFKDLYPVVKAFNDNADDFIKDLELLPRSRSSTSICATRSRRLPQRFVTFDLTVRRTGESVFTTSAGLDPNMKHLDEVVNPGLPHRGDGQPVRSGSGSVQDPPGTATQHDGGTP
jgi:phospholipid/cholesterol/gamma-HCH transport system substrate-binding protein